MIEAYNDALLSCAFYNQDRRKVRSSPNLNRDATETGPEHRWAHFFRRHSALAETYNRVSGWWVGHDNPSFEPRAASALEGILWWSTGLETYLRNENFHDEPGHLNAAVRLVLTHCSPMPKAIVTALLRTETRRFLDGLPQLIRQPGRRLCDADFISEQCDEEAASRLPDGWVEMTLEEKMAAIGPDEPLEPLESGPYHHLLNQPRPSWNSETATLKLGAKVVKTFSEGPPPKNQARILDALEAAGWPEQELVAVETPQGEALRNATHEIGVHFRKKKISFRFRNPIPGHVMWTRK